MLVASTSRGHSHGGGVSPSAGNSENVALMSVAPNTMLAHGSGRRRRRRPCHMPNAEPYPQSSAWRSSACVATSTSPIPSTFATICPGTRLSSRSEEHTSELQSRPHLVCRLLLEKKNRRLLQHINRQE